jgi:hypothetical protein
VTGGRTSHVSGKQSWCDNRAQLVRGRWDTWTLFGLLPDKLDLVYPLVSKRLRAANSSGTSPAKRMANQSRFTKRIF